MYANFKLKPTIKTSQCESVERIRGKSSENGQVFIGCGSDNFVSHRFLDLIGSHNRKKQVPLFVYKWQGSSEPCETANSHSGSLRSDQQCSTSSLRSVKLDCNNLFLCLSSHNHKLKGVAIGAGWQASVAYVNVGCYYVFGIPLGLLMGYKLQLGVTVSLWSISFWGLQC